MYYVVFTKHDSFLPTEYQILFSEEENTVHKQAAAIYRLKYEMSTTEPVRTTALFWSEEKLEAKRFLDGLYRALRVI